MNHQPHEQHEQPTGPIGRIVPLPPVGIPPGSTGPWVFDGEGKRKWKARVLSFLTGPPLNGSQRAVLESLVNHANDLGLAWHCPDTIAAETGIHIKHVSRCKTRLEELGLIERCPTPGRPNQVRLLPPDQTLWDQAVHAQQAGKDSGGAHQAVRKRAPERCAGAHPHTTNH